MTSSVDGTSPPSGAADSSAKGTVHQAAHSDALRAVARAGFVAEGVVFVLIGILALQVAMGGQEKTDHHGALSKVAEQPFGSAVLWAMVLGFLGYALWRFSEAAWGRNNETDEKKRTVKRLASAGDGLLYLGFAVVTVRMVTGTGSGSSQQPLTAKVFDAPGGQTILILAGAAIAAVGIVLAVRGLRTDFEEHLDRGRMRGQMFGFARRLGQVGHLARGLVIALVGVLVIKAALDHQPGKAQGLDVALKSIASAPFGQFLLVLSAAGLICFGAYCLVEARYRRL